MTKFRRMRWATYVARMGGGEECIEGLMGKPEGKKPLERPRGRRTLLHGVRYLVS